MISVCNKISMTVIPTQHFESTSLLFDLHGLLGIPHSQTHRKEWEYTLRKKKRKLLPHNFWNKPCGWKYSQCSLGLQVSLATGTNGSRRSHVQPSFQVLHSSSIIPSWQSLPLPEVWSGITLAFFFFFSPKHPKIQTKENLWPQVAFRGGLPRRRRWWSRTRGFCFFQFSVG